MFFNLIKQLIYTKKENTRGRCSHVKPAPNVLSFVRDAPILVQIDVVHTQCKCISV